jgi:DNA-binding NtrC family response regulator
MQAKRMLEGDSDPEQKSDADASPSRWHVTVLGQDKVVTYALPESGTVTVGADSSADVRIHEAMGPRHQAVLHMSDEVLFENVGTGAVRVRGTIISTGQRVEVRSGDTVALNGALLVFELRPTASARRLEGVILLHEDESVHPLRRHPSGMRMRAVPTERELGLTPTDSRHVVLEDASMKQLEVLVAQLALGMVNVLILGETGVGKDVFAEMLHRLSPRKHKPLLRINCAALPSSLLESELFGHEVGAFTGAVEAKRGLFECAEGGTVFLDEIGELPLVTQAKLLRVIEAREVVRVGGVRVRRIDVRFVAATNRDITDEIANGRFRQDLFFRLSGSRFTVPPLRQRRSEIEPLARMFLSQTCAKLGHEREPVISDDAWAVLKTHAWPGNVRELRNVIEGAALVSNAGRITADDLSKNGALLADDPGRSDWSAGGGPLHPSENGARADASGGDRKSRNPSEHPPANLRPEQRAERRKILDVLEQCGGNQSRTAKWLGISRTTLTTRLDLYGIPRPRKR